MLTREQYRALNEIREALDALIASEKRYKVGTHKRVNEQWAYPVYRVRAGYGDWLVSYSPDQHEAERIADALEQCEEKK